MAEIGCHRYVPLAGRPLQRGRPCGSAVDAFLRFGALLVLEEIAGVGERWKRLPGRVPRGLGGEKLVDLLIVDSFLPSLILLLAVVERLLLLQGCLREFQQEIGGRPAPRRRV